MRIAAFEPDIAPNLGALIRLSACMDVPLDIIEPCGFPLSLKSLRRSAMDYADIADMTRHDDWRAFETAQHEHRLILLSTKAAKPLWDFNFTEQDTLIVGRESAGVPDHVHERCDARILIPMQTRARSLNVAMSAGIALGEALRQLRK